MKPVVLVSGGIDSSAVLWSVRRSTRVLALAFDYQQRQARELEAAATLAERAGVEFALASLPRWYAPPADVPDGHYTDASMLVTVVPNRNMIFLAFATGVAIARDYDAVLYGAHAGDHTIYPDCRPEFVGAMQRAVLLGNWEPIMVAAPFVAKTKAQIVEFAFGLGVPLELTWSCYRGGARHCGRCGTCVERREAFALAGIRDATEYE